MNKCGDCGKEICKVSTRCKSCSNRNRKSIKHSEKTIRKMRLAKKNEKHPFWKGDKVGYGALHIWIRKNKPKPKFCERCGLKPPREVANISGKYKRDINDFKWVCRSCHQKFDGRKSLIGEYKYCKFCKNKFYYKKGQGKTNWNKRQFCCKECCKECNPKKRDKNGRFIN